MLRRCQIKLSFLSRGYRQKHKYARSEPIFTGAMYIAILGVLVVSMKVTMYLSEGRILPTDYSQIDKVLSDRQGEIDSINKLPVLPKLEASWRTANAVALVSGVQFKPLDDESKNEQTTGYTGPLRNWAAQLTGDPRVVMRIARNIQSEVPAFLYDYTVTGGIMKLNITVVGT